MKKIGLTETKLFNFHRIFKNEGRGGGIKRSTTVHIASQSQLLSGARCIIFGQTLPPFQHSVYASSETSDETVRIYRLTRLSLRWSSMRKIPKLHEEGIFSNSLTLYINKELDRLDDM